MIFAITFDAKKCLLLSYTIYKKSFQQCILRPRKKRLFFFSKAWINLINTFEEGEIGFIRLH